MSIYNVTISVQAGTYTGANAIKNFVGAGRCTIEGVGNTTIVNPTSATCFTLDGIKSLWTVKNLKVQTTTSGNGFSLIWRSSLTITGVEFGACPSSIHIYAGQQCIVFMSGNYTISGAAGYHYYAEVGGVIYVPGGITTTVSGTPAFTTFANAVNRRHHPLHLADVQRIGHGHTLLGQRQRDYHRYRHGGEWHLLPRQRSRQHSNRRPVHLMPGRREIGGARDGRSWVKQDTSSARSSILTRSRKTGEFSGNTQVRRPTETSMTSSRA